MIKKRFGDTQTPLLYRPACVFAEIISPHQEFHHWTSRQRHRVFIYQLCYTTFVVYIDGYCNSFLFNELGTFSFCTCLHKIKCPNCKGHNPTCLPLLVGVGLYSSPDTAHGTTSGMCHTLSVKWNKQTVSLSLSGIRGHEGQLFWGM
jgi:hypothetical protein